VALRVSTHDYIMTVEPYMAACAASYGNSCSVLQNVQAKLKLDADTEARIGAHEREVLAKQQSDEQRKTQENEKLWISVDKILAPKRTHCKTVAKSEGQTTECVDDPKWY
jgi:hypothetical protein